MLTTEEIRTFHGEGYLTVAGAIPSASLDSLRSEVDFWVAESLSQAGPWGETFDGRPRFDVAPTHSAKYPALRRVDNPQCISKAYREVVLDGVPVELSTQLIGSDIKFHHSKINLKLPDNRFEVDYHQDFGYTPHTNDDIVTVLLLLDDMGKDDGAVKVVPGSHLEGQKSLWLDDVFTGKVGQDIAADCEARAQWLTGKAGDLCFLHTSLLHASAQNTSNNRRALLISVYTAGDAFPLALSPVPNEFEGMVLRGRPARSARMSLTNVELPQNYRAASFFSIQQNENQLQGIQS